MCLARYFPRSLVLTSLLVTTLAATSYGESQLLVNVAPPGGDEARLNPLLDRVRERINKYHEALFNITVTEEVTQQELRSDATPKGKRKSMLYESVILHRQSKVGQPDSTPIITRTLKSIDGKPAKQSELKPRSKCVDTNPPAAYGDPLSFLLADYPIKFAYSYAGETDLDGVRTAVVSITTPPATEPVAIVEKDDCFRLSRGLQRRATIWIDLKSFDVLQLQWQLIESFTGKLPAGVTRVGILPVFRPGRELTYEKSDSLIRFRPIKFANPEQTLLLPASSEFTWILKGGGIGGFHTTTEYSRYRRFRSSLEIKDSDGSDM